MPSLTAEQQHFLGLSCGVWGRRAAAKQAGLPYNEETITETILLDLATAYPGQVKIRAFNKVEEAKTGADWLWSFVTADGATSFTMLVQAKRLDDIEKDYSGIKRNIGTRKPPVRQIDRLIETAAAYAVPAAYAFYNHVSDLSRVPSPCRSLRPGDSAHIVAFGISIAEADTVKRALPDESFDVHCKHSIPFHCLLCSRGSGQHGAGGTPGAIAQAFAALRAFGGLDDPGGANGLRQGLHPVVRLVLELPESDEGAVPFDDGPFRGLAGVIVIKDAKKPPKGIDQRG